MADDSALENSSAEALVSLKSGKGNTFAAPANPSPTRRTLSSRNRKRNRLFFNDDEDTTTGVGMRASPKKQAKVSAAAASPAKTPQTRASTKASAVPKGALSTPDKKVAQAIGVRLRNLLKLPKAHKWACYESFYSNLDAPIFEGENDFCICLKETFPQLKTMKLRRVEWCTIRRLMGKPRRCSAAFFLEERDLLHKKRKKIRLLQQRKVGELKLDDLKDLPEDIPMPLVIGTKVTARLRNPQDGLFSGTIDALDTVNNTYRVTFERNNLGTHSIPDYEVLSNEPQETMPLSAFQQRNRPRQNFLTPPRFIPGINSPQLSNDPLLGASPLKGQLLSMEGGTYGGFPIKFLVLLTRLSKILSIKKDRIKHLRTLNTDAEKKKSFDCDIDLDFQKKYASTVLDLERLNKDLNNYLVGVQKFCHELAPEQGLGPLEQAGEIKKTCENEGNATTVRINAAQGKRCVKNERSLSLVSQLTSLMLQIKNFAENDMNSFEFKSLQEALLEIKNSLDRSNISVFQNNVEVHVNHIQSGLTQLGNLHAFSEPAPYSLL
ncbi:protein lin-9 homolog [Tubulanus polymorphus]|uniref:protein lin-9 homolog n=1 Tax=Tubulanus polymorphus TaxID=672921 RepID=UPI003DA5A38B